MVQPVAVAARDVADFLYREARLLDQRRFEEWLELFTEDGYVWVPRKDEERGAQASLVDDDRALMTTRVGRLRHPAIHSQIPPAQAVRMLSNITVDEGDDGEVVTQSTFMMLEYRTELRTFGGHYEHHLRPREGGWKIAAKKVSLVGSDSVMYNLGLPF